MRVPSSSWASSCGDVPLGMPFGDGLVLHPGGEALVEPEVVPPLHGDHVAEPLVRHLVGDDCGDVLLGGDGGGLGVDEEVGLAVGDAAEVLHGAGFEVGEGDHVELGHGVLNAEVGVVVVQDVLGDSTANVVRSTLSGVEQARMGTPSDLPVVHLKSPTRKATR